MKKNRYQFVLKVFNFVKNGFIKGGSFIIHFLFQKTFVGSIHAEILHSDNYQNLLSSYHEDLLHSENPVEFLKLIAEKKAELHRQKMQRRRAVTGIVVASVVLIFSAIMTFSKPAREIVIAKGKLVFNIVRPVEKQVHYVRIPKLVPDSLDFCGEQMPLADHKIYKRMRQAFIRNKYSRSDAALIAARANRWFPVITPILKKYHLPEDFKYIPLVETGFINATSSKGAGGFWQLMAPTARLYGLKVNEEVDERKNVEKATVAACRYLRDLHRELHSWTLTAAAYNMGLGNLQHKVNRQKRPDYYTLMLNKETSTYIYTTVAMKELISRENRRHAFRKAAASTTADIKKQETPIRFIASS